MRAAFRLHLAFAGLGATASGIPAILPTAQTALGPGVLAGPPVLFAGLLAGVIGASSTRSRISPTVVVGVGAAIQAVGLVAAALAFSPAWFVVAAGVAGFGFGYTESAGGVAAKAIAKTTTAGALTGLMTTTAGVAAATPLVVWLSTGTLSTPLLALLVPAGVNLVAAVLMVRVPVPAPRDAPAARSGAPARTVALIAIAVAVYVGVESVISGWSSAIPFRLLGLEASVAALGTSAFWLLMAAGRGSAGLALRRGAGSRAVLVVGSTGAALALGASASLASVGEPWAVVALALAVVLLAPSYGLLLGAALDRVTGDAAPRVSSVIIASGAGGGAMMPLALVWAGVGPSEPATFVACAAAAAVVSGLAAVTVNSPRPANRRIHHG